MRIVPCHFIIDSFSNFEIVEDTYTWKVCINIVSTDNTVRERVENVPLYYNLTEQKWSFSEEEYVLDEVLLGDIDGDGIVTVTDFKLLNLYLNDSSLHPLTEKQLLAADVNQDGKVDVFDSVLIRRMISGFAPEQGSAPTKKFIIL